MNKKVSLWVVLLLSWFFLIITVLFGWAVYHVKNGGSFFSRTASKVIITIASFPVLVEQTCIQLNTYSALVRSNYYPSVKGFKMENNYIDSNYILLPQYDVDKKQSTIKLVRISDNKIMHQWTPDWDQIRDSLKKTSRYWQDANIDDIRLIHPLLFPDGSIIFHDTTSPLIKIDKDSKLIWNLNGFFHHAIEVDAEQNIWVSSVIKPSKFLPGFLDDYNDEAISKISPTGKLIFQKSLAEIFVENGNRGLLLGVGPCTSDVFHINDIQPALTSTKYWMKGDLLISLCDRSTVILYRPSTNKILWLQTGPWLHQHDVDFIDSSKIGVFGNNTVLDDVGLRILGGHNEQYIYDFEKDTITTPYTKFLSDAKVSTVTEGRTDVLPNGDLFVEETNKYRLLRGNKSKTIWQFANPIDEKKTGAIFWSRFVTRQEFEKLNFLKHP